MGDLLFYLLKSGCYLIIFYLLFKLLMSGTTFFRFNRVTILAGIIGCMFLPLIEFTTQEETFLTVPLQTIQGIFVEQADGIFWDTMFWVRPQVDETGNMQAINWCPIALGYVYLAGGLFVLCRILLSFYRMFQLIRNGKRRSYGKYKLIVVSEPISSFCWGKYIVVSVSDYSQQSTDGILLHETMHLRYRHTLDLLCMQCLLILYWFNPAIWLLKRELQEVHEFEADNGVLNTGIDATRYQLLLVKKAVGTRLYSMANGFNHSKLKKRITMMLKERTNRWARLKLLFVDNAAMKMIQEPKFFDVMVTENTFGDILTDEGSVISGSMGLLPSASTGESTPVFEPIHGSWPQAKGLNIANPLAQILSVAMLFEYFDCKEEGALIRRAVDASLDANVRTPEIQVEGGAKYGTKEVGAWIVDYIKKA